MYGENAIKIEADLVGALFFRVGQQDFVGYDLGLVETGLEEPIADPFSLFQVLRCSSQVRHTAQMPVHRNHATVKPLEIQVSLRLLLQNEI